MREILVFDADYCWRLGCVASEFLMLLNSMLSVGKWMALDIGLWEIRNRERGLLELQTTFPVVLY